MLTEFVWISFSGIPLSPGFAAMLPPGPGYVAIGRLLIPASLVMLVVVVASCRWPGRRSEPIAVAQAVTRLQQE